MNKQHYPWWGYIKAIVRAYPGRMGADLSGVAKREYEAVQAAVEATERMDGGESRLKVIRLVHWDRTHTLEGAALTVPCSGRWAAKWQRDFFEEVAKNLGILDGSAALEFVKIVYAKWEYVKPIHYRCSRCFYQVGGATSNYCPDCGAKMDAKIELPI